jgi:hypothetical protein
MATLAQPRTDVKSVLILGDSFLKGHFGEYLHQSMHNSGNYHILSIAIGGAGSKTFLPPMRNLCCGYRVRQSFAGDTLKMSKTGKIPKVPVIESAERPTQAFVMKNFDGNLQLIMDAYKTDAVVLVMGENYLNAHEELLQLLKAKSWQLPIIWVGPFDSGTSTKRYNLIKNALNNVPHSILIQSDSIANNLKIAPAHFYGLSAKKLAESVFRHFEPFLNYHLYIRDELKNTIIRF